MDIVDKAEVIAMIAHHGQTDRAGVDYFDGHLKTVAGFVHGKLEKATAYLHDTLEDTDLRPAKLRDILDVYGEDGAKVYNAVVALTKIKGQPYDDYLAQVKRNPIARAVKLADLKHNMDLTRLKVVGQDDQDRIKKYKKAVAYLQ